MTVAIKIEGLTKRYSGLNAGTEVLAVNNLNLEVQEGEIFGFLGPNGAGKTTTIKMLLGLAFPSEGRAMVLGKPCGDKSIKHLISYLPETPYFYEHLSGPELLDFYGKIFGLKDKERKARVEELLVKVGLQRDTGKALRQYSKGMLQRIGLAQALINDPKLLFFDEPTTGLDPIAHMEIRDLITQIRNEGKTVFLSSHQLSDVEMVCDRVAIMNRGKLLRVGAMNEMLVGSKKELIAEGLAKDIESKLAAILPGATFSKGRMVAYIHDDKTSADAIDLIRQHGASVVSLIPQRRSLEDIFVETIQEAK